MGSRGTGNWDIKKMEKYLTEGGGPSNNLQRNSVRFPVIYLVKITSATPP